MDQTGPDSKAAAQTAGVKSTPKTKGTPKAKVAKTPAPKPPTSNKPAAAKTPAAKTVAPKKAAPKTAANKPEASPEEAEASTTWQKVSQKLAEVSQQISDPDLFKWELGDSDQWQRIMDKARMVAEDYLETSAEERERNKFRIPDPAIVSKTFVRLGFGLAKDPVTLAKANASYAYNVGKILTGASKRAVGMSANPVVKPKAGDKRFKDDRWQEEVLFDTLKQLYLLTSETMVNTVKKVNDLDDHTRFMAEFYTQRFADSMAPTNFPLTNPAVVKATMEEKGANILRGLDNFMTDLEKGRGRLKISMVDESAFGLGKNIATTPGKVVFRNELMELIQYTPTTEKVASTPLLIVPPWINKFYILDLKPKNSFIKWAVDQGLTVFVISWVNPDQSLAAKHFENYMLDGPVTALDVVKKITGEKQVNTIGYCIGGTLMSATLAYLKAKGRSSDVASCTFFTTLINFEQAGELKVFIDDEQLDLMENHMKETGFLESKHMASVFNLMRSNDLIWSFVVNNYYLGKDPMAFDLLYWNADATRMPAMQQAFYLRNMYLHNRLKEPGGIVLDDVAIDLSTIDTPLFFLSTKEDHIAPWVATYDGAQIFKDNATFVLAGSGHIAGVINPPVADKYPHWVNPDLSLSADDWMAGAEQKDGSWWPTWKQWLAPRLGADIPARDPGSADFPPMEDAPGTYVRVIANDD